MSLAQIERILSKRPNWATLKVLLQDNIKAENYSCGRCMLVCVGNDVVDIYEGQHNIHLMT